MLAEANAMKGFAFAFEGKHCPGLTCDGIIMRDSLLGVNAAREPMPQSQPGIAHHYSGATVAGHMQMSLTMQWVMVVVIAVAALVAAWKMLFCPRRKEKDHPGQVDQFSWTGRPITDFWLEEERPLTDSTNHNDVEQNGSNTSNVVPYGLPGLLLRSVIICLPCIGGGYNLTVIGASLPSLALTYGLDAALEGVVVSVYCGGCIVGALLTSRLANDFGRKYILVLSVALLLVAQIAMVTSTSLAAFLIGRTFVGISCGLATTLTPMYIAEMVPRANRGLLVSMQEQTTSFGLLIGFAAASMQDASFRHHAILGGTIPLLALCLTPLVAESPRWLIGQQRFEEAEKIMYQYVADREEAAQTLKACQSAANTRHT